jgi:membrane protein implicated in regulation of membrane protease activity
MPPWLVWLLAAGVLAIAEALSLDLFLIMLAGAALATAGVAALGAPVAVQVGVFAIVALGMVGVVRPIAKRRLELPSADRTGIERLKGRSAVVIRTVDQHGGRVRLAGEEWSAESFDPHQVLPVGATVQVMEIRGATAVVWSHT